MPQPTPPALAAAPVLAHVVRGGIVESAHRASVAVTGPDGALEQAWGDPDDPVLPRSSNKPLQALAMLRAGLRLPEPHLALACASHSGEAMHLEGVRAMLADAGLGEADLQNTPDLPHDPLERDAWVAAGRPASSLAQNCSGKHAAMLATCRAAGWDPATYRDPGHPLQRAVAETLADLTAGPVGPVAVDGCGAPVMAVPLTGLARAFGRLAAAEPGTDERAVADAMRRHPELLGGTRRDVTALIRATPGLLAKDGAEAVYAVGLPDGRGVALKVADGGQRARGVILAALLRRLGVESTAYGRLEDAPVLGHGEPVGAVVAVGLEEPAP
ncbi:asparaginase [Phycicoccus endophyticus]|uniref:Asparaginase n=1 Tax=Phycicoccus endophyticus TaxID=1690220 RepID=A0A7G9R1W1_9MICO|nr:asparaginase [Phycicoccus endophyticus]NHI18614.1 asparaginase [Phycicoccus endophyticus]QNN49586.1 asparaginase [Phycicoccus endophyticus]